MSNPMTVDACFKNVAPAFFKELFKIQKMSISASYVLFDQPVVKLKMQTTLTPASADEAL